MGGLTRVGSAGPARCHDIFEVGVQDPKNSSRAFIEENFSKTLLTRSKLGFKNNLDNGFSNCKLNQKNQWPVRKATALCRSHASRGSLIELYKTSVNLFF